MNAVDVLKQAPAAQAATQEASPLSDLLVKPMKRYDLALEPQAFDAAWKIAELCARMKLCGCVTPDDAYLRIIAGRAIGLPAMASVQSIIPIYNEKTDSFTLTMYVKAKLALALSRPDVIEFCRPVELTDTKATFVGKRVGGKEQEYSFTWEDATRAGLVGRGADGGKANNYDRHPRAMLAWRACGRLLDLIAGDVLNGIASHEDVADEVERDKSEPRGAVPEAIKQAIPTRDWQKEADELRGQLLTAVESRDKAAVKAVRKKFQGLQAEAPADISEALMRFYNVLAGQHKEPPTAASVDAKPPAGGPVQPSQAAAAGVQAVHDGIAKGIPAQDPKAAPYLPPHQRGDSYEGPDQPPIPFGAT